QRMTIDEILKPADVNLALRADTKSAAVEEVLAQLRGDARVANWEELRRVVLERDAPAIEHEGRTICIAHGRTKAVTALTMAAGKSEEGFVCPETKLRVNLLFVAGIPVAMDSEYLRLVGAIVRVCRDAGQMEELMTAPDGEGFVELLAAATERL
ncbi:MAG TPA: PTS sugar transporter subunit IIA, partial [Chthoniobacterales bacterium]|nr:PTS sugar transporter subunit IIA [Chthoniobacterales bacterium]